MDHVALIDFEGFINLTEGWAERRSTTDTLPIGRTQVSIGDVNLRDEQALAAYESESNSQRDKL
jgi:hypothetical protein